ncbi:MAG: transposase [Bdellovibrionota bacterium]
MRPTTAKRYRRHRETNLVFGGDYLKTRLGRSTPRPLLRGARMHFVMRSTLAKGPWSFRRGGNLAKVESLLQKFARKHGVNIHRAAVQTNHLHLLLEISSARGYKRFIRAVTAAIAMAVTNASRWNPLGLRFWDRRPFSRVLPHVSDEITADEYVRLNQIEALGLSRREARALLRAQVAEESRRRIRALRGS